MKHLGSQEKNAAEATAFTPNTMAKAQEATGRHSAVTQDEVIHVYDPNRLLDFLMLHMGIDGDGALARRLRIAKGVLHNIRKGSIPVCASMLLWMQEATGIDIAELRRLMGDRRTKFRLGISIAPRPAVAAIA